MSTTRISDDSIEAVRKLSPIEKIAGETVQLRNSGAGSLKGLCPFCDAPAAFNVTPARGLWYCFGCSEGGDVIRFVQKTEDIGFTEAVEVLAAEAGIALVYEPNQHLIDSAAIAHLDPDLP